MTISPPPFEFITQPAQLDAAARAMAREPAIGVDTESNSRHRYPEQLCLIQIAAGRSAYLIDAIALEELTPLRGVLEDASIEKVLHGADYDLRTLDRHHSFRVRNLYDTNIAARFAGMSQVGLASLITELLGVTISKNQRLQRSDWGRRPLSAEALDYAVSDVRHLLALREALDRRLRTLGRTAWVAEECARLEGVRYSPPDLDSAFLSVKGTKDLDGRALAVLKRLFQCRDEEARRRGRPPYYVLPDPSLVLLAAHPTSPLSQLPGLRQDGPDRFRRALQNALRAGLAAPPVSRPARAGRSERPNAKQVGRLRHLKAWRVAQGAALSLDPALLWPLASLERLARAPGTFTAELTSPEVRGWQREQFGSSLRASLESFP